MEPFKETVFFREIMYRFDKANKTMDHWNSHKEVVLAFMNQLVITKVPERIINTSNRIYTSYFYEYNPRDTQMCQTLLRADEAGHLYIHPKTNKVPVFYSLEHNVTDLSLGTLYVIELVVGDDADDEYAQYYLVQFGISLPSHVLLDLFGSVDWDKYFLFLQTNNELDKIPFSFKQFMYFVADVTYMVEDDDTNILEEMNLMPVNINQFIRASQNEVEMYAFDRTVIEGFQNVMFELIIVDDSEFDEMDELSTLLLYFHKKNDPLFYQDTILNVLRYEKLPYLYSRRCIVDYGRDITDYIYSIHLPREKMMCEFHRFLFGINGEPDLHFNSPIANEIRANWDQLCSMNELGLLL